MTEGEKAIPPAEDLSVESDMRFRRIMEELYPNCPHLHPNKNPDNSNRPS